MTNPLVSVIMAVHDGERFLRPRLESPQAQDYEPFEVVFVDDGSTDGSAAIARAFPGIRYVHQENQGLAAARNTGLACARGELVAYLDADERLVPGALQRLAGVLERDPSLQAVYGHVRESVSPDVDVEALAGLRPPKDRIAGCLPTNMLIRRDAFLRVGGSPPTCGWA